MKMINIIATVIEETEINMLEMIRKGREYSKQIYHDEDDENADEKNAY